MDRFFMWRLDNKKCEILGGIFVLVNLLCFLYGENSSIEIVNIEIFGIFWENLYWELKVRLEKIF